MRINVTQLVGKEYIDRACSFTVNKEVHPKLSKLYKAEHSPIRCSIWWIELMDIPTFASVHLVRHKFGVEHFVKSNREDRNPNAKDEGRNTPVNHAMLINAQSLINISRKRMCKNAHETVRDIIHRIQHVISTIDPDLAMAMVPDCIYRGKCYELKCCGGYSR